MSGRNPRRVAAREADRLAAGIRSGSFQLGLIATAVVLEQVALRLLAL